MLKKKAKYVFLVWSISTRRSETLAKSLNAKIVFFNNERKNILSQFFRYFLLTIKTLKVLKMEKADFVFVQNPPIYSLFPVFLYAMWYRKKYIIDSHTITFLVERIHHHFFILMHRFFSKFAFTVLIHNEDLSYIGKNWRTPFFILEDRIPQFQISLRKKEKGQKFNLVVICSFSPDEPIAEILQAAQKLEKVQFYLTGDFKKVKSDLRNSYPSNITFTGFLEEEKYVQLLRDADAIMALTTRPYTLLCGAYEAVAVERPLITSSLPLLKRHFHQGTIHVENTPEGIEDGIRRSLSSLENLRRKISELRVEKEREWKIRFESFQKVLYDQIG